MRFLFVSVNRIFCFNHPLTNNLALFFSWVNEERLFSGEIVLISRMSGILYLKYFFINRIHWKYWNLAES